MSILTEQRVREIVRNELKTLPDWLAKAIGTVIAEMVHDATKEFRFIGTWEENKQYKRGNFVSLGGQVYHCNIGTTARPGTDSSWTLAVKSGRDGRDGRDAPAEPEQLAQRTTRSQR